MLIASDPLAIRPRASMIVEVLFVALLVLANGVFAMSEIALVSARHARLRERAERGEAGARRALALATEPDRFLATIQVGITLVGTLAGAFGGARLAGPLAGFLRGSETLATVAQPLALALVVLAIAYTTLVVGELVPKRIGLAAPERVSMLVAGPMETLARLGAPLVWLLTASTRAVLALLPRTARDEPPVTEAELRLLLDQGTRAGVFDPAESELVSRVFWMGDQRVDALMTPRGRIVWLPQAATGAGLRERMSRHRFTRYLVCDGTLDQPVGIAEVRDLWAAELSGARVDGLAPFLRQPLYVPPSTRALELLERFRTSGVHVAVVIDEFGSTQGLVTLNDLVQGLAGDMPEAGDPARPGAVRRDDGSWLVDGALPLEELAELTGPGWPGDAAEHRTVAGMAFARFGHLPGVGEHLVVDGWRIEVVDLDGLRIDKLLLSRVHPDGDA